VENETINFTPTGDGDNAGTITLDDTGGVNFKVSFKSYSGEYVYAYSLNKKTWHDSVSLQFYKKEVEFYLAPSERLSGILVTPLGAFRFGAYNYLRLPLSTGDYTLVLCGATADGETPYAFLIDSQKPHEYGFKPSDLYSGVSDVARYEPNNTEQTATAITRNEIVAYLHKDDFDYYRFRLAYD
jgi:hypothetical protein